jgi:hypothetical protein
VHGPALNHRTNICHAKSLSISFLETQIVKYPVEKFPTPRTFLKERNWDVCWHMRWNIQWLFTLSEPMVRRRIGLFTCWWLESLYRSSHLLFNNAHSHIENKKAANTIKFPFMGQLKRKQPYKICLLLFWIKEFQENLNRWWIFIGLFYCQGAIKVALWKCKAPATEKLCCTWHFTAHACELFVCGRTARTLSWDSIRNYVQKFRTEKNVSHGRW